MKLTVNFTNKTITMIENNKKETDKYTDIYMAKKSPLWKVMLEGGEVLVINFKGATDVVFNGAD